MKEMTSYYNTKKLPSKFSWLVIPILIIFFIVVGGWLFYASIIPVSIGGNYTKDLAHVYYKGVIIPNADPWTFSYMGTFSYTGSNYAKDAHHAYLGGTVLSLVSDTKSFMYIGGRYTKDVNHVYWERGLSVEIIQEADPKSFVYIGRQDYAKDVNHVYYINKPIPLADPRTFILIEGYKADLVDYSKDANYVYHAGEIIPNADPKSFMFLGGFVAKDKNQAYYSGRPFFVTDLKSLIYVGGPYAKDSVYVYGFGNVVWGANPAKCTLDNPAGCKGINEH